MSAPSSSASSNADQRRHRGRKLGAAPDAFGRDYASRRCRCGTAGQGGWDFALPCPGLLSLVAAGAARAEAARPADRIIGGTPIAIEQAPWQVAIAFNRNRYQGGSKERFACGGSLIAPNVVLTAAHCVYATPVANGTFNGPEQYEVYVGRARLSSGQGQVIPVAAVQFLVRDAAGAIQLETVNGPDVGTQMYETTEYFWDLAVLSLSAPATVGTPFHLPAPTSGPRGTAACRRW